MTLRAVFAGTPAFALPSLQAMCEAEIDIPAVYTQPDRPAGRGRKLRPGPIKQFAIKHGLSVRQPQSLGAEIGPLAQLAPDLIVVVAYGLILPQTILDLPR
ncbi:MAG TPA: formyltransferase family protein, partial [Arenicellales bacterium]|nr:formyltransferase family protein [Arenicellales bacterium]